MIRTASVLALLLLLGGIRATESGPAGAAAVAPGPAHLVHDFFPGQFGDDKPLPQLTRLGNVLFFVASDRDTGTNVWRTDGTRAGTRVRPASRLVSRPSAREREVQAKRALEPRWRRMLR